MANTQLAFDLLVSSDPLRLASTEASRDRNNSEKNSGTIEQHPHFLRHNA